MSDVARQFQELVRESEQEAPVLYDTVIIGGGAAGAGVLRDLASRGNARAILVDRGPFGGETSSKSGKAIHPGIRYLRMGFHRILLAFKFRKDPKLKQSFAQNMWSAWQDLRLVWYGTRERNLLIETCGDTVEAMPNIVFVYPDSPESKWAVFFGISIYGLLTTIWAWPKPIARFGRVELFIDVAAVRRKLPHLGLNKILGAIRYWDGKASNDKILVLKAIRDAYFRGTPEYPLRALSYVELERYEWCADRGGGYFLVTLIRRFESAELPERIVVKARTVTNASGPWLDQVRNRGAEPDRKKTVVYSRGSHLEATNRFLHESLSANPSLQVGLVPLNPERQHYLRPFFQNGIWYIQCTTTDRAHTDPDEILPQEDEIEELLHSYNELVDDKWKIARSDIFNVFCGVRPLASSGPGEISVKDISRMFKINPHRSGDGLVFDLINVKLTEFRWAGRVLGDLIAKELRQQNRQLGKSTTHRLKFLTVEDEERFAINRPDHPRGDLNFIKEKIRHYVDYQMVCNYADYLLNSGGLRDALVFNEADRCDLDQEVLDLMLEEMGTLLQWSHQRRQREWQEFEAAYSRNMAHCDLSGRRSIAAEKCAP
nr:FAD-dependent oxidoreductase [Nitrospirillum iridis]